MVPYVEGGIRINVAKAPPALGDGISAKPDGPPSTNFSTSRRNIRETARRNPSDPK